MAESILKVHTQNGDVPVGYPGLADKPIADKTLSKEGAFADSKAVGDKFKEVKTETDSLKEDLAAETSRATAVEDTKADKAALARTDRSLDALWKLNQGISYEFQTDDTEAYQKMVPTGAKLASVEKIGGRTLVWNQMIQNGDFSLNSMWSGLGSTVSVEGNTGIFTATEAALTNNKIEVYQILSGDVVKGHKYCARFEYNLSVDINDQSTLNLNNIFTKIPVVGAGTWGKFNSIVTVNVVNNVVNNIFDLYFFFDSLSVGDTVKLRNVQLFDLTRMFGPDNEPSTVEEFEAMFPADYYPYNEGELLSMGVNEVVEAPYLRNLYNYNDVRKYGFAVFDVRGGAILYRSSTLGITGKWKIYDQQWKYIGDFDTLLFEANKPFKLPDSARHIVSEDNYDSNTRTYVGYNSDTSYVPYGENDKSYNIPQSILQLDGYGDGVTDNVYNYVDWENKKYHKRVGKYTIDGSEDIYKENSYWVMTVTDFEKPRPSTKNAICVNFKMCDGYLGKWGFVNFRRESNGFVFSDSESKFANSNEVKDYFRQNNETIYYELNEEQIIDISDIIDNTFQEPIEVEAGGSLTFQNTHGDNYRIPVPNTVEYTVKLSEVAE